MEKSESFIVMLFCTVLVTLFFISCDKSKSPTKSTPITIDVKWEKTDGPYGGEV